VSDATSRGGTGPATGLVLATLAAGQFLMALDSSVMNVSIATVASDVGTTVTGIQGAITAYTLVMAMFMMAGGKIGARMGLRRAFMTGCVIYGCGSLTTALAPDLAVLLLGWSLLEGLGAALILPAIVALVAVNFDKPRRPAAYGLVAAAAAVAIAVGPLIGGLATTYFSWRWVFAGEVVAVAGILVLARRVSDAPPAGARALDVVGMVLAASSLGAFVYGVLRSSEWGWFRPKSGAPSWLGASATLWLMLAGLLIMWVFRAWEIRVARHGREPLVRPGLLRNRQLGGGLTLFFFQYLIQMGVFFVVPLYLSVALGLSALKTGVYVSPLSLSLLLAALLIPRLAPRASPRRVVQLGMFALLAGAVALAAALDAGSGPAVVVFPMLIVGLGMGALASQLGAVTVSAVPDEQSADIGGVQNTVTNLGASIGTALAGSILIATLTTSFLTSVEENPVTAPAVSGQTATQLESGVPFLSDAQAEQALQAAGVSPEAGQAALAANSAARLDGLRAALAVLAFMAVVGLFFTPRIPDEAVGAQD
jgi:EmrB/QacA subfamily drug resistance transporter